VFRKHVVKCTAVARKNLAYTEKYGDEYLAQNDYYAAVEVARIRVLAWSWNTWG